jgi:hypothetical protein
MKLTTRTLTLLGSCCFIALFTGCGSIMCGSRQKFVLDSLPTAADVTVYDSRGEVVLQKTTPFVTQLDRRDPSAAGAARYVVLVKKDGYAPAQFPLVGVVNRAYCVNVLSGCLGYAIDPMTGGMWTLVPQPADPEMLTHKAGFFSQEGALIHLKEESAPEQKPAVNAAQN